MPIAFFTWNNKQKSRILEATEPCCNLKVNLYFSAILNKADNFVFMFAFLYTIALLKRNHSERKEFAPMGSKFFPFRVDSFSEGGK